MVHIRQLYDNREHRRKEEETCRLERSGSQVIVPAIPRSGGRRAIIAYLFPGCLEVVLQAIQRNVYTLDLL